MVINLRLDPQLIERALELSGEDTETAAITKALEEFIARREHQKLVRLFGELDWAPCYDYKAERSHQ